MKTQSIPTHAGTLPVVAVESNAVQLHHPPPEDRAIRESDVDLSPRMDLPLLHLAAIHAFQAYLYEPARMFVSRSELQVRSVSADHLN